MGIDPGLSGGIALLGTDSERLFRVWRMPTMEVGGKRHVNGALLADLVRENLPHRVFVEAVGARPGQGVTSMFSFGRGLGVVEGVMAALQVPIAFLSPAAWRGAVKLRGGKDDARGAATRLWPDHARHFSLAKDDGVAEAALIALAGARSR